MQQEEHLIWLRRTTAPPAVLMAFTTTRGSSATDMLIPL